MNLKLSLEDTSSDILISLLSIRTCISLALPYFSGLVSFWATYHFCSLFPFQEPLFAFYYLCPYSVSSSWFTIIDCAWILHVWYPLFSALTFKISYFLTFVLIILFWGFFGILDFNILRFLTEQELPTVYFIMAEAFLSYINILR